MRIENIEIQPVETIASGIIGHVYGPVRVNVMLPSGLSPHTVMGKVVQDSPHNGCMITAYLIDPFASRTACSATIELQLTQEEIALLEQVEASIKRRVEAIVQEA